MAESAVTRLTIDLGALVHNHDVLRQEAAGAEVAPVLKADGYGLGAGTLGARLWDAGARTFFVARLSEGETLRGALTPDRPATIYVLDGFTARSGARLAAANLTPALSTLPQVSAAQAWPASAGRRLPVALHVDTGMNRQGVAPDEARALVQSIDRLRGLDVGLVMSHLGSAESPKNNRNVDQLARFLEVRSLFPQVRASLSASAGSFLGADYRFDMVRPGVSLFGGGPEERPDARLKAVATLTAPIADVRNLRPGDILGYGDSIRIAAPTRVAVVSAGYADGIIRAGKAGGYAWFAGARRRILIITMDLLVIDIENAEAAPGDEVELLGANTLLDDLAKASGSVAHEVLVRLSRRAERTYIG